MGLSLLVRLVSVVLGGLGYGGALVRSMEKDKPEGNTSQS